MSLKKRLQAIEMYTPLVPKGLEVPLGRHPNDEDVNTSIMVAADTLQESNCYSDLDYPSLGYSASDLDEDSEDE